jgi:hypothetical protein
MNTSPKVVRCLPSPRDIIQLCQQLQAMWSPAGRMRRIVRRRPAWLFPSVQLALLRLEPTGRQRHSRN